MNLVPTVSPGYIVAGAGRTISLNVVLTGTAPLIMTGGGTFSLKPSGASSVNTFSGSITVANGTLNVENAGAFNATPPNIITLGSSMANVGVMHWNTAATAIGGLSSAGNAGNANYIDNGVAAATLTINNSSAYIFSGALKDGATGSLTLVKNGVGNQTCRD